MDKMRFESPDITDEYIQKISQLFPGVVTEGKINFDFLRSILGDEVHKDEAYEFTWVGKRAAIAEAGRPIRKALRPCKEESKDWDATENLYIEGDNLDVLKLLQESYLGKVKMIYLDPPYNTGNDFVYRDNFTRDKDEYEEDAGVYGEDGDRLFRNTERNGRFHSDWCSMMYPRLVLARNLLSDDGVIFISIDDNEQANLTKICDEVFGSSNRIGPIIQNKQNAKNDTLNVQKNHEFILVYRRAKQFDSETKVASTLINRVSRARDVFEESGNYYYINDAITTRGEGGTLSARPNLGYSIYYNPETNDKIAICDYDIAKAKHATDYDELYSDRADLLASGYVIIRPPRVRGQLGCWTWSLEKFNEQKNNTIITGKKGAYAVKKRTFVPKALVIDLDGRKQYISYSETNLRSIIDYSTNDGTIALNSVMGDSNVFNNPKNLRMLSEIIQSVPDKDSLVLDFFSGSATTAHAVMQLNAEDNGKRKFIMVQLPEVCDEKSEAAKAGYANICEIGKERIRRAGDKIKSEAGMIGQDLDIGFRVLKLDSTNMRDVYYSAGEYSQDMLSALEDNIKEDRNDMDLLFACLLDWGLPLSMPHTQEQISGFTVHTYNDGDLIACFDKDISDDVVKEIARRCGSPDREGLATRAVFRDLSFANSPAKINVEEIFKLLAPNTSVRVI
jgi:adenine-specific DNA-methyltransferase